MRDLFNDIFEGWFDSIINNIPLINREENISSDMKKYLKNYSLLPDAFKKNMNILYHKINFHR